MRKEYSALDASGNVNLTRLKQRRKGIVDPETNVLI
jgi:hypothetical protein